MDAYGKVANHISSFYHKYNNIRLYIQLVSHRAFISPTMMRKVWFLLP